jgi:hypothetical protein
MRKEGVVKVGGFRSREEEEGKEISSTRLQTKFSKQVGCA